MVINYKLLSEINNNINIDDIKYSNSIKKYPLSKNIDFDWKNILSQPAKNSSKSTLNELIYISSLTLNRTSEDIDLINRVDQDPSAEIKNICKSLGINFPQNLFDKLYDDTKNLIYTIKQYYNRPRPQQLANFYNLKIDVIDSDTAHTASYPSGHTVYAKLAALLVEADYLELRSTLTRAVNRVAYARCIQGVHFPSDNKASIILANFIYQYLTNKLEV